MTSLDIHNHDRGAPSFAIVSLLVLGYFFIQVAANLTVVKVTPLFGSFAIPVGSLLYAVSFTWIDLINQTLGKRNARLLVIYSILFNILLVAWLHLYIYLPGMGGWAPGDFKQQAIEFVFGGLVRVYLASWIGTFISENTDIIIFHFFRARWPDASIFLRAAVSNAISAPLDGFVFAFLAFTGVLEFETIMAISITSAVYKLAISLASLPLLLLIRSFWTMKLRPSIDE
jgi:uncharacterized integral membrane protein (TIGR00697 family)